MTRLSLLALLSLTLSLPGYAQEDPLYAQYLNNPLVLNPAYAGLNNNFNAAITYRKQWGGFDGAPSTASLSGHTSLFANRMGLGLMIVDDKSGNTANTEVYAAYAYRVKFNDVFLSMGLQGGFVNYRNTNTELNPYDPNDPAFSANQNITKPSVGAGLIVNSERFFVGLSAPRMLQSTTRLDDATAQLYTQHYYLMAAYVFYLSERVRFKPSALLKKVKGAPLSTDYHLSLNLDERYVAGLFTRNFNTYGVLTQFRFATAYRVGYAFEMPTNRSVGTRFTTHEFSVAINLSLLSHQTTSMTNF